MSISKYISDHKDSAAKYRAKANKYALDNPYPSEEIAEYKSTNPDAPIHKLYDENGKTDMNSFAVRKEALADNKDLYYNAKKGASGLFKLSRADLKEALDVEAELRESYPKFLAGFNAWNIQGEYGKTLDDMFVFGGGYDMSDFQDYYDEWSGISTHGSPAVLQSAVRELRNELGTGAEDKGKIEGTKIVNDAKEAEEKEKEEQAKFFAEANDTVNAIENSNPLSDAEDSSQEEGDSQINDLNSPTKEDSKQIDSTINNAINSDEDISEIVEKDDFIVQSNTLEIEQTAELESDPTNIASDDDNTLYDLVDNGQGGMSVAGVDMNPVNSNVNTTNNTENTNITNTEDISSINPSISENTDIDNSSTSNNTEVIDSNASTINSKESISNQDSITNVDSTQNSSSSSAINAQSSSTTSSPMMSALYSYFGLPDPGLTTETTNSQINEIGGNNEISTNYDEGSSESVYSNSTLNSNITESKSESQDNVSSNIDVSKSLSKMDTKNYPISTPSPEPSQLATEDVAVESLDAPSNNTSENTSNDSSVSETTNNSETNSNQNVQNPTGVNVDMSEVVNRLARLELIMSGPLDVKIVN